MSMHVYTFENMNGKQCQVTTSTELSAELLAKYKKVLGIACTHTVEEYGNDIARAVVVDSQRDTSAIEAAVLRKLRIEMDDFDPKDSHVFMAGQIKCIAMLDKALAALRGAEIETDDEPGVKGCNCNLCRWLRSEKGARDV